MYRPLAFGGLRRWQIVRMLGSCAVLTLMPAPLPAQQVFSAVYVMRPDGSDVRKVASVAGHDDLGSPRWSRDSQRLMFDARNEAQGMRNCFVVHADGSGLKELAAGRAPDWSPDDKQFVFQEDAAVQVSVQTLDNKGQTSFASGRSPRWSPDGGFLAVSDRRMLHAIDLVSGEKIALLEPASDVLDGFCWSPNGKRLAVVIRPAAGAQRQLLLVDAAGNDRQPHPRATGGMGGFVSFSPEGKYLVYSEGWKIKVLEVDGDARPRTLAGQQGKNRHPDWSPDGNWIAFVSDREAMD